MPRGKRSRRRGCEGMASIQACTSLRAGKRRELLRTGNWSRAAESKCEKARPHALAYARRCFWGVRVSRPGQGINAWLLSNLQSQYKRSPSLKVCNATESLLGGYRLSTSGLHRTCCTCRILAWTVASAAGAPDRDHGRRVVLDHLDAQLLHVVPEEGVLQVGLRRQRFGRGPFHLRGWRRSRK